MIVLVSGERGSGKDTVVRALIAGDVRTNWRIYGKIDWVGASIGGQRMAFADKLKAEVNAELMSQYGLAVDDSMKEQTMPSGQTLRRHYIDRGMLRRHTDPDYWCKLVWADMSADQTYFISDWRFPNEADYFLARKNYWWVATIRVFRMAVERMDDISERSLDAYVADYVLVPVENHEAEFAALCRFYPQYAAYKVVE